MDEHQHFQRFRDLHREGMALAQPIDKTNFTQSNGHSAQKRMQGIKHLPESLPSKQYWREVWRNWWYRFAREWEPVVVNKQIDSITMPKWAVIVIFGAILAFGAQSWWRASDQRDMLIELKTEMRMAKEFEAERAKDLKAQSDLNKVYIDNMTNQLNIIKSMLTAQQLGQIEAVKRGAN